MKALIIPLDNARCVRLPQAALDACKIKEAVELTIEGGKIILAPVGQPRAGWTELFAAEPAKSLTAEEIEWLEAPLARRRSLTMSLRRTDWA